jgi:aminoglycoside phosphotransferase (APT) family kinase protein
MDDAELRAILRSVAGWERAELQVEPLPGGITNRNHLVTTETGGRYVVRIPGERTELLGIDRAGEAEAATRAAMLGIGPPVLGELPGVGTLVTELVPGHHLDAAGFADRIEDVVELLRRFHDSGPIAGAFPIHRVVEWHARDAAAHGVEPPRAYGHLHASSTRIEAAFAADPDPLVPCHNDLLPANVLFDTDRTWLLDFEYAGMNDCSFDLGNLSVNAGFSPDDDERLLRAYFGEVTPRRRARLELMKIMSELREGMWSVVQQAISTLDTDFVAYADERLASCERLAGSASFERWLGEAAGS